MCHCWKLFLKLNITVVYNHKTLWKSSPKNVFIYSPSCLKLVWLSFFPETQKEILNILSHQSLSLHGKKMQWSWMSTDAVILPNMYFCSMESPKDSNYTTVSKWWRQSKWWQSESLLQPSPISKNCTHPEWAKELSKSHPAHSLFELLPSGRRYRALSPRTTRHRNSFFPQAIHLMNTWQ